jgi:hypothetical protein
MINGVQGARATRQGSNHRPWRNMVRRQCICRAPALVGGWGVPVAESALAPPGPIPNPVVTQCSAGEYCGGDPMGGEAAADTPQPRAGRDRVRYADRTRFDAGWSSGSSLGS